MGTVKTTKVSVNVLDLLKSQHSEVDTLLEKLEGSRGAPSDRAAVFLELADKLAAHATVEEKIFYPAAMSHQTDDLLHESVEEHLEIKRILADMIAMDPDSDQFKAKLSVLKENVSHHAHEEEEKKLFPILRKSMTEDELAGLGNEVLALFEELMTSHPSMQVPGETGEAAPLPSPA